MERERKERRKVNQPVGEEKRRSGSRDRRRCPQCGSALAQSVEQAPGGTLTRIYCLKCPWKSSSRQVDEDRIKALAGFEMTVQGSAKRCVLPLDEDFTKAAGLKPGDSVEIKAIYVPGTSTVLTWILKRME